MNIKTYAGIGSRKTPPDVLEKMTLIAKDLGQKGFQLRSGGAAGADNAFERGAILGNTKPTIYVPGYPGPNWWADLAKRYHPVWDRLGDYAKQCHTRNVGILLGQNILEVQSVNFIICWTKNGGVEGGTGQALRIAQGFGIPIFNLYYPDAEYNLHKKVYEEMK